MAQATVKTVQYLDPRIEPQPDPLYDYVIGPTQNQYYQIPASGLSDSSLNFNNLTTLGIDRAYLDTFELELGVTITFNYSTPIKSGIIPQPWEWTFDSFPFNKCCDEARVNINGGAFFSQPMSYIRAKERYMNQYELSRCYENLCPTHKPYGQTESGRNYNAKMSLDEALALNRPVFVKASDNSINGFSYPTRYGIGMRGFSQSAEGTTGGFNNDIVRTGGAVNHGQTQIGWGNYCLINPHGGNVADGFDAGQIKVTWREPIFVSPFSSKYDATYGRPLYNITSMDFSFTMQNLGNMIRLANYSREASTDAYITSYNVHIDSAKLCYQVMTIPPILNKPLTTLVPYRRFVPYITNYNQGVASDTTTNIPTSGATITIQSGVYTLNEIPTAIWAFVAPTKAIIQGNEQDSYDDTLGANAHNVNHRDNWDSNKLFGFIKAVNISMANTTQILATAKVQDLYRIAKANGCEDSYLSWAGDDVVNPLFLSSANSANISGSGTNLVRPAVVSKMYYGAGSVLRLKPGVDLIVPDQPLIPGANANNMVFQCNVQAYIPPHSAAQSNYALWLLFEYVGVAAISPGQCEITMNPLGSGEIMAVSPVMSATSDATEGELEGSGFWDGVKKAGRIMGQLADDGIISKVIRRIPGKGAENVANWLEKHGFGEPACKRTRGGATSGGAVIGKGLNDWV